MSFPLSPGPTPGEGLNKPTGAALANTKPTRESQPCEGHPEKSTSNLPDLSGPTCQKIGSKSALGRAFSAPAKSYSREELEVALQSFRESNRPPKFPIREPLLAYIRDQLSAAMSREDYDLSSKLYGDLNELQTICMQDQGSYDSSAEISALNTRYSAIHIRQHDIDEKWKEKVNSIKAEETKKIEEIRKKYQEERVSFEDECHSHEYIQQFSKPSNQLIEMRKIQRMLAISHDFIGAKEMKEEADKLQSQETEEARERAIKAIKQMFAMINDKEEKEIQCLIGRTKQKIENSEVEKKKELLAAERLSKQLDMRIREAKTKKGSRLPPLEAKIWNTRQTEEKQTHLNISIPKINEAFKKQKANGLMNSI